MMRILLVSMVLIVALHYVSANGGVQNGVVMQNGFVHRFNLSDPKDPNKVAIAVSGNFNNGWITFNITAPSTFCIPPTNSCGRNVQDVTVVVRAWRQQLSLYSLTNNPSPFSFGVVSNYHITGVWTRTRFHMIGSYMHDIAGVAKVPMKYVFAGSINHHTRVLRAHHFGFVAPYLGTAPLPYQYLITYGEMDSSQPFSVLAGYRAVTPHQSNTSLVYPAAPIDVFGTVNNLEFDGGLMSGKINLQSTGNLININQADFFSDFHQDADIDNLIKVNVGIATDDQGKTYFLDNLNIISH